jgi:prophage antirepressor-like protein
LTTIVDNNGNPWWVATEVCKVLGYENSRGAVAKHCKSSEILKRTETVYLTMPNRGMAIINESDLYRMIMAIINESDLYRMITHSHLPAA